MQFGIINVDSEIVMKTFTVVLLYNTHYKVVRLAHDMLYKNSQKKCTFLGF